MSAAIGLVSEVARRLVGGSIDVSDVVEKVKAELAEELLAVEARVEAKLVDAFAAIGLLIATDRLADGAQGVLDAFDPKGDIKPLGLNITEVGPDETLVDTVVLEVPEPKP